MNPREIDETLLTAYALGELDAREHARVAAHVEADAEARRHVDDVRDAAAMVTSELGTEPVEGLLAIQREMIERRLHETGTAGTRFGAPRRMGAVRRWLPLAASVAASVAIVGGIAVVLLPNLRAPIATDHTRSTNQGTGGITVIGPDQTAEAPTLPDAPINEDEPQPGEFLRETDVAHGGDVDGGPVDGMRDPREAFADRGSDLTERPEAPAVPAPKTAATPKNVEPRLADGRGPAHSPEAEDIRARAEREKKQQATPPAAAKGKRAPKVYVSTPRDPKAFEEIKNRPAPADLTRIFENPFRAAKDRPRSAFPLRVERWSYNTVRNSLNEKQMPPPIRVRVEELVNHFAYDYPSPSVDGPPLAVSVEVATCPWDASHRLARVAIKAREGGATVVAQGVEAAVEFNPQATAKWRLVGYENTPAASQPKTFPFDLAAGGTATAFYEIVPQGPEARHNAAKDLFTVKVTYREPGDAAKSAAKTLTSAATDTGGGFDRASEDFRFATSAAAFGMLLRGSQFAGTATYADVIRWATAGKGADATKAREGMIELVKVARDLDR